MGKAYKASDSEQSNSGYADNPSPEARRAIVQETLESLLDSDMGEDTCVCQLADTAVCDHNWSLCNEIRHRLNRLTSGNDLAKKYPENAHEASWNPPQADPIRKRGVK